MIFSTDSMKRKPKNIIDEDKSLFEKCLSYIKEDNSYQTITSIHDSIDILDKKVIKDIMASICNSRMNDLSKVYIDYLNIDNKYISESRSLISKDDILNIDDDFYYEGYRYQFANLRRVLMYSSFKTDVNKETSRMIQYINEYLATKQISDMYKIISEFEHYKKTVYIDISMIRGELLGLMGPVDIGLYAGKLFHNFRPNNIEEGSNISKTELIEIYDRYASNEVEVNIIKKDFDKFMSDITYITSSLDNIPFDKILEKDTMNTEFINYPIEVISTWIEVMKMILDTYELYFSARMDASLQCLKIDIDILATATDYVRNRQQTADNKQ